MQNFQDTSETGNWSFISAYSICITVPLKFPQHSEKQAILFCIFSGNVLYDSWVLSTNHYILSQSSIRLKEKNIYMWRSSLFCERRDFIFAENKLIYTNFRRIWLRFLVGCDNLWLKLGASILQNNPQWWLP